MPRCVSCTLMGVLMFALPQVVTSRTWDPAPNWSYLLVSGQTYYLYTPSNIQPGRKYPIVLTMHGCCWDGDTSHTLGDPMTGSWINEILNVQPEPFYILAPHNQSSYQTSIVTYLRSLFTTLPIDTQRVIVAGFSMGASGVATFLNAYPRLFSAAMAVAIASGTINTSAKDVPMWLACGANDGYRTNHENSVVNLRAANGDTRGALTTLYGVNPRYDVYPFTGHGDAMEGLFGTPGAIEWALSHRNDGNHRPVIKFTQSAPVWMQVLPSTTTSITVSVDASDNDGAITKVEFFLNGQLRATTTSPPYQATITGLVPGDYILTATATDNGISQGKAFNKTATDSIRFGIQSIPQARSGELPRATAGVFYRDTLKVSGGNWPYNWTVAAGSSLPPGLSLTRSGRLEGIPTQPGAYTFDVTVADTNGFSSTAHLSLTVGPVPPNVVLVTNIVKRAVGPMTPWIFRVHEPYKTTGLYGLPKGEGLVRGDPHPIYDAVLDVGPYDGATFIRPSGQTGDINSNAYSDWLSFDINIAAKVHVAFPRGVNHNNVPSWLNGNGWTRTGIKVKAIRQEYYDYVKEFPAGRVTLGPNDGTTLTNINNHYLTIIEPASVGVKCWGRRGWLSGPDVRIGPEGDIAVGKLSSGRVTVWLLDTQGRLVSAKQAEGVNCLTVSTKRVACGAYLARVKQSEVTVAERLIVRP